MAESSANDHGKEIEQPRPDDKKYRIETVLVTAQILVGSAEQFLLLHSMVSTVDLDTTLAAVMAARAVLNLMHAAFQVVENRKR